MLCLSLTKTEVYKPYFDSKQSDSHLKIRLIGWTITFCTF